MAPVEHINGKIAPQAYKVRNTSDPDKVEQDGYLYGYRHKFSKKNCFAIRTNGRYLVTNPYTQAEQENRDLFTSSLLEVQTHWQVAGDKALCIADFEQQHYYKTARGFAVAMTRENGGQWLSEWIAPV